MTTTIGCDIHQVHGYPVFDDTFTLTTRAGRATKEESYGSYAAARAAFKAAPYGAILSYKVKIPQEETNN